MVSSTRITLAIALAASQFIRIVAAQTATTSAASTETAVATETLTAEELISQDEANKLNDLLKIILFVICGFVGLVLAIYRIWLVIVDHTRLLACLANDKQRFFLTPYMKYAHLKKYLLDAPVWSKRHNREFQVSNAMNMGTLPTRFQFVFLVMYLSTNIAFCLTNIHWDQKYRLVAIEVRHRSGILAVVNMIPLFLMATRNSPLIYWLDMTYDSFNLLHRWFGRIVIFESLLHTLAWLFSTSKIYGWEEVARSSSDDAMVIWGWVATAAIVLIVFQSMSFVRHAFYETFKYIHIALAIITVVGIWYHLRLKDLPQYKLLLGAIVIWLVERAARAIRIGYRNFGNGGTKAHLEALPGNAVRVTVDLARPWNFCPGTHAYLYMPSIGGTSSHPFSVAWSEDAENPDTERGIAITKQDVLALKSTRLSFVIRARTGFTYELLKKAEAAPEGKCTARVYVEGPYGAGHLLHSYGTVMLIAGGIGITHQVPHVRDLVAGYANGTVATRRILLVWIIQSPEHLEWIRPWMTEILAMEKRRDILRIMLFISRPRSTKEIHSPSATVQMFPGRPNIETLMDMEIEHQVGAFAVSVCGSGSLSDDVRGAVRDRQTRTNIDFSEEAFTW